MTTDTTIERIAEAKMDALDRRYLSGAMTTPQYELAVRELDRWVTAALAKS